MNNNPIKIVTFEGELTSTNTSFKFTVPYSDADLQTGSWRAAIRDFSYQYARTQTRDFLFDISSTLVWGYKFSEEQQTISYELPLVKVAIFKEKQCDVIQFPLIWYNVTLKSNTFVLNLQEIFKARIKLVGSCKINITLLLQRV